MVAIAAHGGCGPNPARKEQIAFIRAAVEEGGRRLDSGAAALDVVEAVVRRLEDSGLYNAGRGARRQLDGVTRRDAAIMDGRTLGVGAVASLEGVDAPIALARRVMEATPHVMLSGAGASLFAERNPHLPRAAADDAAALYAAGYASDTVGCVALDGAGHLCAATSTGGSGAMLPGRIGDAPIPGAGLYAEDGVAALSATGTGETILRVVLAKAIAMRIAGGEPPEAAAEAELARMGRRVGGHAGVIVIDAHGTIALAHHHHMIAAWRGRGGEVAAADRFKVAPGADGTG